MPGSQHDRAGSGTPISRDTLAVVVLILVVAVLLAVVQSRLQAGWRSAAEVALVVPAVGCAILLAAGSRQGRSAATHRRPLRWWCNLLLMIDLSISGLLLVVAVALG